MAGIYAGFEEDYGEKRGISTTLIRHCREIVSGSSRRQYAAPDTFNRVFSIGLAPSTEARVLTYDREVAPELLNRSACVYTILCNSSDFFNRVSFCCDRVSCDVAYRLFLTVSSSWQNPAYEFPLRIDSAASPRYDCFWYPVLSMLNWAGMTDPLYRGNGQPLPQNYAELIDI